MRDIYHRPPRAAEGGSKPLDLWNGAHEKRHVDARLWFLPRLAGETTLGVDEIVLHVHDNQCRSADVRSHRRGLHMCLRREADQLIAHRVP